MSRSLTVVSGLSGAGKTVALRMLEDLGYYCVDNLPADLLPAFVESVDSGGTQQNLAVGIDVRNHHADLGSIGDWLSAVGKRGWQHRLVFFDAADAALVKRYSDTRRRHPLSQLGLALPDAIALERQVLRPVRALADHVFDTTALNVHQLRKRLLADLEGGRRPGLTLLFESFAYKRGLPVDADFVFDTRCLPNPTGTRHCARSPAAMRSSKCTLPASPRCRSTPTRCGVSSNAGCRASSRKPAATCRSPSAVPAAAIVRSTSPRCWPRTSASMAATMP